MTLVRNRAHDRIHPAKRRIIQTLGFIVAALAGATAVLWSMEPLDQPALQVRHEPGVGNTTEAQYATGDDAEAIFHRYDDCVVNAAAICTT